MSKFFHPSVIVNWYDCYCLDVVEGTDRHQLFADCQKISRQEAKVLCYKISYSIKKSDIMEALDA